LKNPILIVGGGLGGLTAAPRARPPRAAALRPRRRAFVWRHRCGIEFGPNVFHVFDRIGVSDAVLEKADSPPALLMIDALNGNELTRVPTGPSFRSRRISGLPPEADVSQLRGHFRIRARLGPWHHHHYQFAVAHPLMLERRPTRARRWQSIWVSGRSRRRTKRRPKRANPGQSGSIWCARLNALDEQKLRVDTSLPELRR
jgi:hypothetical protein